MGEHLQREYEELNDYLDIPKREKVENPKVSIIIPVYNVQKYIKKALDSVINQTLTELEIICVNDCTPDKSFDIVKEYAKRDKRFVLLEQEKNQGQGVARNSALDIATGDYIMFLDPDDWFELDACEKAYNQIHTNQNDMVFFNIYTHKEVNGKIISSKISNRLKKFDSVKDSIHVNLAQYNENWLSASYTWAQIYSNEFLRKYNIRYSEERFTEDVLFFIKAVISSEDISILDAPLYNSRRKVNKMVINYYDFYDDVFQAKKRTRDLVLNSVKKDSFWINYLIYETRTNLKHLIIFCKNNKKAQKELYPKIRKQLIENYKEIPKNILENYKFYKDLKIVLNAETYLSFKIRKFLSKIFK